MKINGIEIFLIGLCLAVLALVTLLIREEIIRWWTTRHDRRLKARFGRRLG